jgi:hypothetical protein
MAYSGSDTRVGHVETILVLCFSVAAIGYGVALWTNVVSYTLPGFVYLLAGALLALWGISLVRRR